MTSFPYGFPTGVSRPLRDTDGLRWPRCVNSQPGTFGHECGKPATCVGTHPDTLREACFCDECAMHGFEARHHVITATLGLPPNGRRDRYAFD